MVALHLEGLLRYGRGPRPRRVRRSRPRSSRRAAHVAEHRPRTSPADCRHRIRGVVPPACSGSCPPRFSRAKGGNRFHGEAVPLGRPIRRRRGIHLGAHRGREAARLSSFRGRNEGPGLPPGPWLPADEFLRLVRSRGVVSVIRRITHHAAEASCSRGSPRTCGSTPRPRRPRLLHLRLRALADRQITHYTEAAPRDGRHGDDRGVRAGRPRFVGINGGPEFNSTGRLFPIECDDQEEIDYYWERLADGGEEGPCGWLKDRYGLSWQVVPAGIEELFADPTGAAARAMQAMLRWASSTSPRFAAAADG